ncbi:MATE family efflux transporter [Maritalea porphyrae]|uniref:MATE family efflux transporter n=1 Tax=Maritalea porphyrae TaxID=880732 RepID=A0ABQ5UQZ0_9HYPH|nr:MATE family efflux transporter [Maritalea porphyrae]GLQ17562.1 MATE family efflux transporter [Maritalea porphyrae]
MTAKSYPFKVGHKDVWHIALPTAVAFVTEPLVGIADTTIVGRLGEVDLLGGLLLGGLVFDFIAAIFYFLRLSTTGLTAQAFGARDDAAQAAHLVRAVTVGFAAGLLVLALMVPIAEFAGYAYGASPDVVEAFKAYFFIRVLAAPFVLMNFALVGWFLGRGESFTALILQLILNVSNILLSIWFTFGLEMGIAGVAWGTVAAQLIMLVVGLVWAVVRLGGHSRLLRKLTEADLVNIKQIKRLLSLSGDILIRSVLLSAVFSFFASQGARAGDDILAANGILLHFLMVAAFFLDGLAAASEQLCGKAIGARWRPAFVDAIKLSSLWGFILSGGLTILFMIAGPAIIDFMTTSEVVRQTARDYLFIAAIAPVFGVLAFVLDGVFAGATMGPDMRNGMIVSTIIFAVVWAVLTPLIGIAGLWWALHSFFIGRSLVFLVLLKLRMPELFARVDAGA